MSETRRILRANSSAVRTIVKAYGGHEPVLGHGKRGRTVNFRRDEIDAIAADMARVRKGPAQRVPKGTIDELRAIAGDNPERQQLPVINEVPLITQLLRRALQLEQVVKATAVVTPPAAPRRKHVRELLAQERKPWWKRLFG